VNRRYGIWYFIQICGLELFMADDVTVKARTGTIYKESIPE